MSINVGTSEHSLAMFYTKGFAQEEPWETLSSPAGQLGKASQH